MRHEPQLHPEELLATFVEGTASPHERATVEGHLSRCAVCRAEVELARAGLAAALSLPELEAPAVAVDRLGQHDARAAAGQRVPPAHRPIPDRFVAGRRTSRRGVVWQRVVWGAGLASAAAVIAVFVLQGGTPRDDAGAPAAAPDRVAEEGAPGGRPYDVAVVEEARDHTPESLAMLAQDLADTPQLLAEGDHVTATRKPASVAAADVIGCVEAATGSTGNSQPVYLGLGTYGGTPAYVGGFLESDEAGTPEAVLVFAVERNGCRALYVVRQPV
jgi:hypothetical protein